jgi:hypothetical protein
LKEKAERILHSGQNTEKQENTSSTPQPSTPPTEAKTATTMPGQLPKDYKVAIFESKGAPLTFKQVPLELPKAGEVSLAATSASG